MRRKTGASAGVATAVLALWAAAAPAKADTQLTTIPGNDCPGFFGSSFSACVASYTVEGQIVVAPTPVIIKFR